MTHSSRTKIILTGGVLFTLFTVGISAIYVPEFSDAGRERRELYQNQERYHLQERDQGQFTRI